MTRFVYGCAVSLDGFIADPGGGVGFLDAFTGGAYGTEYITRGEAIVMGRGTYDDGLKLGWKGDKRRVVLLSRDKGEAQYVDEISSDPAAIAASLRKTASYVWVMGGGRTASAFLEAGALTDVIITVVPVVLGGGTPLFGPLRKPAALKLRSSQRFDDGVVTLDYEVR